MHEHFTESDWVDFARQTGDREHRARVARHLAERCASCEESVRIWATVVSLAEQEALYAAPEPTLREVRGQFSVHGPWGDPALLPTRAVLLFDSLRLPHRMVGLRSAGVGARQLLYKAGRYTIKLQVEAATGRRLSIVGQILDDREPSTTLGDIAVLALTGRRTVDRTLTNPLGEFHLEPSASDRLQLSVDVPEIGTFTVQTPASVTAKGPVGGGKASPSQNRGKRARPR